MLLTPIGWADRVWALPFMSVLCPSQRYYTQQGRPAVSLIQRAQSMLRIVAGWLPGRRMVVVADSSFAALAFLDAVASYVTVVTRLRLDAALYTRPRRGRLTKWEDPAAKGLVYPPSTPSGRSGYALATITILVGMAGGGAPWKSIPKPPCGITPACRPYRFDGSSSEIPSHLCASSVAINPSEPVAPADADVFYSALGGRNHL